MNPDLQGEFVPALFFLFVDGMRHAIFFNHSMRTTPGRLPDGRYNAYAIQKELRFVGAALCRHTVTRYFASKVVPALRAPSIPGQREMPKSKAL